ncbi:hypothetical protein A4X13_0g5656 [Tilletia indica]|uniref:Uncharacterized protein n=1 Tax=Tilletia indica TaxID=43049 RepID=A0A8T8SUD9_9BASI|nr:hypothetical protein A4X13_0g5656 [Tilletia indica]
MAVTEGKIEFSRLLFNASNLPAMTEDYNLALFKLGTACLESTRLSGMSRELATIRTPAGTWVEMDGAVSGHGERAWRGCCWRWWNSSWRRRGELGVGARRRHYWWSSETCGRNEGCVG